MEHGKHLNLGRLYGRATQHDATFIEYITYYYGDNVKNFSALFSRFSDKGTGLKIDTWSSRQGRGTPLTFIRQPLRVKYRVYYQDKFNSYSH